MRGMSMRDAGILDGDLLAVHRTRRGAQRPDRGRPPRRRGHGEAPAAPRRHAWNCCRRTPISRPSCVDLEREALAIEGIAVGLMRNGKIA
ncbi:MAG: hypothetical protein MZW92_25230 [Comamonadaceae bacterium]|nr:hypothetical protein [Comamonadaceae bacterium]